MANANAQRIEGREKGRREREGWCFQFRFERGGSNSTLIVGFEEAASGPVVPVARGTTLEPMLGDVCHSRDYSRLTPHDSMLTGRNQLKGCLGWTLESQPQKPGDSIPDRGDHVRDHGQEG
ncbi:hypothetical protein NPX13_g822 [Xylaria arbuscula]|uniref:Uncharacterized protein n=1 Tax=Xylaria arbuscula TaxID=114810 RepID=A0A9W8NN91_9PEZI|nr:hypothetical protein NPX13_g822 [Xylaria arbuscula]